MFGKGFLGDIGTRLQRLLKFDGSADASFDSKAIPVMVVGDATLPGYGDNQGRRFVVQSGIVAGGSFFYVKATQDVIINQIRHTNEAAGIGNIEWRLMALGTADPVAPASLGLFLDRSRSTNDRPPIVGSNNPAAAAGAVIQNLTCTAASPPVGTYTTWCDQPFLLASGQAIGWLNNSAGINPRFELWGQIL